LIHDLPNKIFAESDEDGETKDPPAKYYIDREWYDRVGKSFSLLVSGRMCVSCQRKLGTEQEERVPAYDEKTGRVTFEVRRTTYGENPLAVIQDCCSRAPDFITPGMPIKEMLFRILLAAGNEPLELDEIKRRLDAHLGPQRTPPNTSPEALKRLLEKDTFYGIKPLKVPAASADS